MEGKLKQSIFMNEQTAHTIYRVSLGIGMQSLLLWCLALLSLVNTFPISIHTESEYFLAFSSIGNIQLHVSSLRLTS